MSLHICRKPQWMMPVSAGVIHGMQAITKQASAVFEGETLVNRAYSTGSGKALINKASAYDLKVDGVVSGCAVTPTAVNNTVAVAVGVVNINGVAIPVTGDDVALTRPADGKKAIYCLSVGVTGATLTATKGTDHTSFDWSAYGGNGQMPLCPVNEAVVGYVAISEDEAALILPGEIFAGESANLSYDVDDVRGKFILPAALPLSYTGAISRPVFATWYSQDGAILQPVAEYESGKLDVKTSTLNVTPGAAGWERHEPGRNSWTASMSEIKSSDNYRLTQCLAVGSVGFIKARINSTDPRYFIGKVIYTGTSLDLKFGEMKMPLSFQGTGELCEIVG